MDGTYQEASYAGCGCAGGEVVTLTDEVGRQRKVYSDVLGRTWKTEVLDNYGSVYSAMVTTYNARDQVTRGKQYAGVAPADASSTNEAASCPTGTCQETVMTYDGYGRLSNKHVPEQNAGTATLYAYNPDDTIASVTDARGASATYSYNSRHLVTAIAYSAPAGITAASNVGFTYDAAGNRTSMTDGFGSKTYSYNQLSQMMSETRIFNDPANTSINGVTKTLSYDYNLAGELKKITDSTNMTINYGYDGIGRLSGVTGSGTLYAGVSNYASNFQYRAWGGLKAVTDGTNHVSSLTYNSKLQPSQFDISGSVVHQNYDYYNDGRISFVHNTTDPNFDRSYFYDHMARLTEAKTGGVARGDYGDMPYNETFGYDAFSNLTSRSSDDWNQAHNFSDDASYSNNRRVGWGYDADGRNTTVGSRTNGFDAAGRQISMSAQAATWNGFDYTVSQVNGYDGGGRRLKEVDTQSNAPGYVNTTYYVRSSLLGDAIVEEVNNSGQKNVGYVCLPGGQLLANQTSATVTWKHNTPAGTGEYTMNSANSAVARIEFDAIGADISLTLPENPPPEEGDGDVEASHFGGIMDARWTDFFNPSSGFVVDGSSVSASEAMFYINFGTGGSLRDTLGMSAQAFAEGVLTSLGPAVFAPAGRSVIHINVSGVEGTPGHQTVEWQWVNSNGQSIFVPIPTSYSGTVGSAGSTLIPSSTVAMRPQNPVTVPLTPTQLKGLIQDRLNYNNGECADYVNRLISLASKMAPPSNPANQFKDIPDLFDQIIAQPKGGLFFEAARGRVGIGSGAASGYIVRGDARITITPVSYYPNSPSYVIRSALENAPFRYGITGLHEVIHQAGKYWWDDDFLTEVAKKLEPDAKISDWDHALQNHCLPPNRRYNYDYTR